MAGREQGFEGPIRPRYLITVMQHHIGIEVVVDIFRAERVDERALVALIAAITTDLGLGRSSHLIETVDVVPVCMRDYDVAHGAATDML